MESEPWAGSVRANAPSSLPVAMSGSQRFFCSSLPHRAMDRMASPPWTPETVEMDPSPRESSMATSPAAILDMGGMPGTSTPSRGRSSSPMRRTRSRLYSPRSQYSAMTGSTSSWTNFRARSWWARSSSVTWSNIPASSVARGSFSE